VPQPPPKGQLPQDASENSLNTSVPAAIATSAVNHQEHPDLRVFGLLTFLVSECLMFGGFFATYLLLRGGAEVWPPGGTEVELCDLKGSGHYALPKT
jgi:cytochrome c oxidase subunit 3